MDGTRSTLEQVVGALKGRAKFRLRGRDLNREHDALDVFPAVADEELSPGDEGRAPALLWSREADRAFAAEGALTRPLVASWGAPRKPRRPRAPAGPFTELHRHRAPNRGLPVSRLAFDPGGAALAVAQARGLRGWPEHPLYCIDVASGAVRRVFTAHGSSGSCGGCEFLRDGRLVYSLYDFDPKVPLDSSRGIVRLLAWEPESDAVRELAVHRIEHICEHSLSTVDGAGERVAVVTATGVSLLEVGPVGAAEWQESARVGGPAVGSYPLAAISRDGRFVAWTADGVNEARCVDCRDGSTIWSAGFFTGHHGGRSTRGLGFDPRAEHLVALCHRTLYNPRGDGTIETTTDRRLQFYAVASGAPALKALATATAGLTAMAWHPDGSRLAVGTAEGELELRSYPDGALLATQKVFFKKGGLTAIAFDGAGERAAVGGEKGEIAVLGL